jgi:hypothetical protein
MITVSSYSSYVKMQTDEKNIKKNSPSSDESHEHQHSHSHQHTKAFGNSNTFNLKMASQAKKPRFDSKAKSFYAKQARKPSRNSIEVGDKGFLVTCNFREKDSIREVYRLLNEYYSKLHKEDEVEQEVTAADDDIESQLKNEIEKTTKETKEKAQNFQSIDTGVQNLIFIKTTIEDPLGLGETIIRDLAESKMKKTKVTLRLLPIETICKVSE